MSHQREKSAAVIFNPTKVDAAVLRSLVTAEAARAGWIAPTFYETSEADVGQGMASHALAAKVDLIFAAGGDGTVRAVAEVVSGTGVPLALLPAGTGNLLARNLHLTLDDMPDSVRAAFAGIDRKVDVGRIEIERADGSRDSHAFVVMAGMGIDAKMIKNTDDDLKAKAGWAAYVNAIAKSLRDPRELRLTFRIDGASPARRAVHTVIVGNCGSLPANILLMPDAVVDDGMFDLMMTRPEGALGWLRVWARVAWTNGVIRRTKAGRALIGEHRNNSNLHYETAKTFEVRLARPDEIELDGDEFGKAVGFAARIDAGALTIRVPSPV